ncbi:zinc finger protein draculin-like [Chironomus tepperi]|uniref:zinc finger protein draculin-like n=1 Tax=Chironomus tepperi TaxID=113505 RepID=UPI00391FA576
MKLMNNISQDNPLKHEDQTIVSEIKIGTEEFEVESDQVPKDFGVDLMKNDSKPNSNRGRKRKVAEIVTELPTKPKSKKLKVTKVAIPKLCKKVINDEPKSAKKSQESHSKSSKIQDSHPKSSKPQESHLKSKKSPKNSNKNPESEPQTDDFSHLSTTKNGKLICPDCNRPILKSNYKDHITQKHSVHNTFICDLCLKKFHQKSSLECHMKIHLKIKPYTCPENCGKSFYSKHGLYFHNKMHHQPINEFICEICAKTFKQSHLLQEHIDAKHDGVRYKCTYEGCGNEYNTNAALKRHIISIHECKIVPCEFCGDLFRTGFSLYQHVRTNHKERKIVCEYEGCGKKFVIKTHYRDHLKMHTGKKDFICKFCDVSYHKKRNLTRHIEVVHQKSRFYCQIDGCGASLCNKDNYRLHLRKVHGNHPETKDLLDGLAKMKPVFLDSVEDVGDDDVGERNGVLGS